MSRWIVARVINSPRGAVRTARLIIADVPPAIGADEILTAIERAGLAAEFSEAGVPFGNHEVKAEARGAWRNVAGIDQAEATAWPGPGAARPEPCTVTWANLTRERTRGEGRRITLRVTDAELAACTLAAKRAGCSLNEWAVSTLLGAADMHAAAEQLARVTA